MSTFDPTFSNYTNDQAQKYAKERTSYSSQLYDIVIKHHVETGGRLNFLTDVGCGPGNATRDLALYFDTAIGLDPGVEMVNTARDIGGITLSGKSIEYAVCGAEDLSRGLRESHLFGNEKVDLITAAMAAHWFDMPKFWNEATRVLKPGGTVALWTCVSLYCHPSTSNYEEVQRAFFRLERDTLAPYELPANRLSRDLYENLTLPWDTEHSILSEDFPKSDFVRLEWDRDGVPSNGDAFFSGSMETTMDDIASGLETASMVTRWREAHNKSSDVDCIKEFVLDVKKALGVSYEESPSITVGSSTVLLLFKRK